MRRSVRLRWLAMITGLFLLLALLGGSGSAFAAAPSATVGSLSGSTAQGTRLDSIEILGYSHSVQTAREAGSGLATGRRQYQPLLIRKRIDKASPLLMKAMAQSESFPTLRIAITETGVPNTFSGKGGKLTITLTDAQIVSIATGAVACAGTMEECVSFVATKIEWSIDGVTFADEWVESETETLESIGPTYFMAINEKGVPAKPKKQTKASYRVQISSPRDAASGLPTGKRQHQPLLLALPDGSEAPELLSSFLTGRPIDLIALITYGPDGKAKGAFNLEGVRVLSVTDTRVWGDPHVDERDGRALGSNPLYEASEGGSNVLYGLQYNKIKWLDATGKVTHEDTWDTQR